MAQDTALQVIELQQLPIIVERLHSVKADIERRTAEATSLICTEETYKSVKDARAQLTKEFKEYEAQRTAIKSKILEPYNAFEQVYRECVTAPFQQADAELKQKIADVTSGIVAQKTEALMDYYGELVEAADIDWLDNLTYRPKVNMSDSLTSLKKQAKAFVDGIVADVAAIEGMDNAAEIMVEYRSNLDLPNAIKTVGDRHKALEEQRRREEERRARQAEREAAAEKARAAVVAASAVELPAPVQEPSELPEAGTQPEPQPELQSTPAAEPILMTRFYAKGTKAQLIGLKHYLEKEGIEYNENANESGTITVTLMGTSSSLPYVRSLALKRKEVSLMIVDANDSASVNVAEERCRVIKPPDITRAKEIGSESVSIFVPSLNYR